MGLGFVFSKPEVGFKFDIERRRLFNLIQFIWLILKKITNTMWQNNTQDI